MKSTQRGLVKAISVAICQNWSKVPDGCAALCMDRLGSLPKDGCRYAEDIHGKMAKAILKVMEGLTDASHRR